MKTLHSNTHERVDLLHLAYWLRRRSGAASALAAFIVLFVVGVLPSTGQAGPTVQLTYVGDVEGLQGTLTMQFEDIRTGMGTVGFFQVGGRPAWAQFYASTGGVAMGAQLVTPTQSYLFNGTFYDTWTYVTLVPGDGSETFLARVDFPFDANFVYMDRFTLTSNPLGPGTPTAYYFQLAVPTSPPGPDLKLTGITLSPGGTPKIQLATTPGSTYRLLSKDRLNAPTWNLVSEITATNNSVTIEDRTNGGVAQRFYLVQRTN